MAGHPLAGGRGGFQGSNQDAHALMQQSLGRGVPLGMNYQQRQPTRTPPPPPPGGPALPQGYPQAHGGGRGVPLGGFQPGAPYQGPPGRGPPASYAPGGNRFAPFNNLPPRSRDPAPPRPQTKKR